MRGCWPRSPVRSVPRWKRSGSCRRACEQERLVRELELAHDLQLKLLPDVIEQFDGNHDVAARCAPAESVGGDFYQLFQLSGDRVGIMIGDVSSHGFSAALIMALTMSAAAIYAQEADRRGKCCAACTRRSSKELEIHRDVSHAVLLCARSRSRTAHVRECRSSACVPHRRRRSRNGWALPIRRSAWCRSSNTTKRRSDVELDRQTCSAFSPTVSRMRSAEGKGNGEDNLVQEVERARKLPPEQILDKLFATRRTGRAECSAGRPIGGACPRMTEPFARRNRSDRIF